MIKVKVIKAILTHDTQIGSEMDPFVMLKLGTIVKRGKTFDEAGDMLEFNEQFQFPFRGQSSALHLIVYDEDATIDDLVGEVEIDLKPIISKPLTQRKWYSLKYNGRKPAGKIMLEFQFRTDGYVSTEQKQFFLQQILKPNIHSIGNRDYLTQNSTKGVIETRQLSKQSNSRNRLGDFFLFRACNCLNDDYNTIHSFQEDNIIYLRQEKNKHLKENKQKYLKENKKIYFSEVQKNRTRAQINKKYIRLSHSTQTVTPHYFDSTINNHMANIIPNPSIKNQSQAQIISHHKIILNNQKPKIQQNYLFNIRQ